jgi:methylmalonyl-CoA mutase
MALHLHVRSASWIDEKFQPHGNLLKATTAAMAAVMGGCNALTIDADDANNITMTRMARNVSSILREESHLDKVADPLAGAYAVQEMTHALAHAAWPLLQQNLQQP